MQKRTLQVNEHTAHPDLLFFQREVTRLAQVAACLSTARLQISLVSLVMPHPVHQANTADMKSEET